MMRKLITIIKELTNSLLATLEMPRLIPSVSWNF